LEKFLTLYSSFLATEGKTTVMVRKAETRKGAENLDSPFI
jgi:hypothetical protein